LFLGLTLVAYSQQTNNYDKGQQGGLFGYGMVNDKEYSETSIVRGLIDYNDFLVPNFPGHGTYDDQSAPLGSGTLLLIGLGMAYSLKRKKKED
jgi:hypothetical protein